jgi:hypothetical protein
MSYAYERGYGLRIVDEDIELATRKTRDFIGTGFHALFTGDIEGEGAHAFGCEFLEDGGVSGGTQDMIAWDVS